MRRPRAGRVIEGTAASAAPGGPVNRQTYEALRDEILQQLRAALPLDAAIFGLHGAMVAHGYDDCEGDLLQRAREIVGPEVLIAAEFDPHCHFTKEMAQALDIAVFYKEFPHVDFYERAEDLIGLVDRTLKGEIAPRLATYDCRMIDVLPTSREPMQGFVEKIRRIEREDDRVLDISVVHGFRAADVPEMGTKVVVLADGDHAYGHALAKALAQASCSTTTAARCRRCSRPRRRSRRRAPARAGRWCWPTSGAIPAAACRATTRCCSRRCCAPGSRTRRSPRSGTRWRCGSAMRPAKALASTCVSAANPAPASAIRSMPRSLVRTVQDNATQTFVDAVVSLGPSAVIQVGGIEVILNSYRTQPFEPTIFTNLGIPATERDILVVKSTNHFYKGFAAISADILYVECPGVYPSDYKKTDYRKVRRPLRPLDDITWEDVERNQTFG